jgi:F0F1-type ATP synthase assembly protein I
MALFSIVSLTTGGGFIIGTILGLVGGMLSIIRRR